LLPVLKIETPATSFKASPKVLLLYFSIVSVLIFCSKTELFSVFLFCVTEISSSVFIAGI
jgi:hypothetical protein